jgi:hypothetical protein
LEDGVYTHSAFSDAQVLAFRELQADLDVAFFTKHLITQVEVLVAIVQNSECTSGINV